MYKKLKIIHYRWHDVNYSIVFFCCLKMYIKGVPRKKKFLVCHHKSSSILLSSSLSLFVCYVQSQLFQ